MIMELAPLSSGDRDIPKLIEIHRDSAVAKYISLSENYFEYVTGTKGVVYYKIIEDGETVGGIHGEFSGDTLYLSICVAADHRRRGIAETALRQLFTLAVDQVNTVEVSIDETNAPSIRLFQKMGFVPIGKEDELLLYRLTFS
ncbi:MAG: GNAT family N-acetyltransferase [Clostridia bacterium]|nr:GNAT family N-acetyltransferase [Clostridia bacterium]